MSTSILLSVSDVRIPPIKKRAAKKQFDPSIRVTPELNLACLQRFFDEFTVPNPQGSVREVAVFDALTNWCRKTLLFGLTMTDADLRACGISTTVTPDAKGRNVKFCAGISMAETLPPEINLHAEKKGDPSARPVPLLMYDPQNREYLTRFLDECTVRNPKSTIQLNALLDAFEWWICERTRKSRLRFTITDADLEACGIPTFFVPASDGYKRRFCAGISLIA